MIKGAITGLGKMGLSHAAIVGVHAKVDMVAVCDTSSLVLNAFNKFSKVNTYTDHQKMIDVEKPDFVVIATPTKFHFPMVKYALDNGVHVFCEKPFTLTAEEGKELTDLAVKNGLVNQIGFHNHFIGTFRELKRLLHENVLGELVHFSGEAYGPVVTKEKGSTWRSNSAEGGGCLYDYASHVINLIQEIIGRPEKIQGTLLKSIYSKGVEDAVFSLLKLKGGLSGTLLVNWSDETFRKMSTSITVQGKNGKIVCDATEIKIYLKKAVPSENLEKGWTIKYITDFAIPVDFYLRGEEYSAQIDHFVDCVEQSRQSEYNSFEQAMYTDSVIEMILEDAKK
ncbi:gfo/Idh/MocA family oxidoreductase [Maribellus comscasis]|uniref:Gfo/Idh/MocA family oxidoreductase n=1 Tax=Maribellus comscasis TaxID=2681766 RepID=A0A6I6JM21_9BACT|nr:Gfo/Idh/MocA family oxidoreductase [Maribellus comscasis]QGY43916.1 gfo/Idh/MocA family oxidoreductase [Maribellus comscasis]